MTKWRCTRCDKYDPCFYDSGKTGNEPIRCPLVEGNKPYWEPIRSEDWGKRQIPEKSDSLPDWIKIDAICWHKRCGYFKVTWIDDVSSRVDIQKIDDKSKGYLSFHTVCNEVYQARLRPYDAEEMNMLVGKVLDWDGDRCLATLYDADMHKVYLGAWYSADSIMERFTIDGLPCGVLEHLNEEGEWVE